MRAHVGKDPGVVSAFDHVDREVGLRGRPRVERKGDVELGRLAVRDAGDVADFSPYDLLLPEEGGDEEADDRNAEEHRHDGPRNLSAEDAELPAAQPPRVTMRHR